jgi:hypothetical protein
MYSPVQLIYPLTPISRIEEVQGEKAVIIRSDCITKAICVAFILVQVTWRLGLAVGGSYTGSLSNAKECHLMTGQLL